MLQITTAADRQQQRRHVKTLLLGASGVGKTTLATTLPADRTVVLDAEAGDLALGEWGGQVINLRQSAILSGVDGWTMARDMACLIGMPDPAAEPGQFYSQEHFAHAQAVHMPREKLMTGIEHVFFDSLTVLSRTCLEWAARQPEAFNKQGKADLRGAYGLLAREMIRWVTHMQHAPGIDVVIAAILDPGGEDNPSAWVPQVAGQATSRAIKGIFDEVITMAEIDDGVNPKYRALVTGEPNPWNYPAKDRSGCLDMLEPPDLFAMIRKISASQRKDVIQTKIPGEQ